MTKCADCGAEISAIALTCPRCGRSSSAPALPNAPSPPSSRAKRALLPLLLAVLAAYHLEMSPHVLAWVKNDRIDFDISYEFRGVVHNYLPDYLVRIDALDREPVTYILEVKGFEAEQDRAKSSAAIRWCRAVNHHGGFGRWMYFQTKQPGGLRKVLQEFHDKAAAA
jgi:hypothetical protein